ncbi:LPS assembly lipoprotein LptE [Marinobacter sp. CA1]|uniref:LPS-assembly lipoprotein LptE n=1 Tax=Marinobacter sp. CA1 TaxID=2817656 RepID=UPI001D0793BF|nr:LPS assembly lipoprotein LptE [Marinobacter sp. CA1]UDL03922.1 hypothetical protein J2887_14510 [Marinobacter sp. CA1]
MRQPVHWRVLLPVLLAAAVLSGCGFQLRSSAPVPAALQPLAVSCAAAIPAPLCQAVEDNLRLGGVELASRDEAHYRLNLGRFDQSQRTSAVTLQGAAAEYDLRQRVWIDVIGVSEGPLLAGVEIRSSETFRYDEDNVLAKEREQRNLESTLYQRLAQQILFRLSPLTEARIQALQQQRGANAADDTTLPEDTPAP